MQSWPDLQPILAGLAWAIVGGVATRTYMPERATKYLDILVEQHDGSEVIRRLEAAGYRLVTELAIPGFLLLSPEGVEVDLLLGNFPWLTEALARPTRDPAGYPVLDLPYLILMKLETSRAQDVGDISRMMGLASPEELARVRAAVNRYAPDTVEDIESLIYLGQLEFKGVGSKAADSI